MDVLKFDQLIIIQGYVHQISKCMFLVFFLNTRRLFLRRYMNSLDVFSLLLDGLDRYLNCFICKILTVDLLCIFILHFPVEALFVIYYDL